MSASDDGDGGVLSRRTIIRLLVGLGIGVPIIIETATFFGLVGQELGDGGDGDGGTETPTVDRVGEGEELLPETPARETLLDSTIRAREDAWRLTITVDVENTTEMSYQLELGAVTLLDGKTVDGGARTAALAPGDSAAVTGRWDLPPGSTPDAVDATAIVGGSATTKTVPLQKIPVQGS